MATSLTSRMPLEPHNSSAVLSSGTLGCSGASATTPSANDFEATLDDALLRLRALLKAAQLYASSSAPLHASIDAGLLSKAAEVDAIATELTACLQRTAKHPCSNNISNNNNNNNSKSAARVARKKFDPLEASPHVCESWGSAAAPQTKSSQPSIWSGFYNKTLRERFDVLSLMYPRIGRAKVGGSDAHEPAALESADPVAKLGDLPLRTANLMIENCIGVIGIPLGLGLNFVIDGKSLSVPMAVEEPSVVAAASSAAKLVAAFGGGFRTATSGNIMTSQIQLVHTVDMDAAVQAIAEHRDRLLALANTTLCPNMKKRGGGAVDIYCRVVSEAARAQSSRMNRDAAADDDDGRHWYVPCDDELEIRASDPRAQYLVVHIDVDVCEAMGANIVNTVAEGLSNEVCRLTQSQCGLRILTNLCMQRRARSTFEIPVAKLGWKGVDGEDVAQRIVEAYNFAAVDPYRAVTNNKGIMNGVDSVALATGQDYRAIEAAAHCYASRSGQYASLSHYDIVTRDGVRVLRGQLELPIAVGSKGGALQTHPGYTATHAILQQPTARGLSSILLSVGLAQNFAAIRAIAITGIQKGHMALHARNIAVAAGAPSELVSELCAYMLGRQSINVETAKEYLHAHAVYAELQSSSPPSSPVAVPLPSMFYVEIPVPHLDAAISLNIAFESLNKHPQYIAIMAPPHASSNSVGGDTSSGSSPSASGTSVQTSVQRQLLGDKGYNQLEKMFMFLASMRSIVVAGGDADSDDDDAQRRASRANLALQNRLQLLSVLLNILAYRLLEVRAPAVRDLFRRILASADMRDLDAPRSRSLLADVPAADDVLGTGLPLFLALWQVFHYHIEQEVAHPLLRARLVAEQRRLLHSIVQSYELDTTADDTAAAAAAAASATPSDELSPAFIAYMSVQAKRWQATMLLLIDSLTLASEVLTPARLDFLTRIGEHMEWEGTIAHDIARYTRAVTERVPNAFLHWLHARGVAVADAEDHVDDFRRAADVYAQRQWRAITADRESAAARVFSLSAVERVIRLIRGLYGERSGRRSRKESF